MKYLWIVEGCLVYVMVVFCYKYSNFNDRILCIKLMNWVNLKLIYLLLGFVVCKVKLLVNFVFLVLWMIGIGKFF